MSDRETNYRTASVLMVINESHEIQQNLRKNRHYNTVFNRLVFDI